MAGILRAGPVRRAPDSSDACCGAPSAARPSTSLPQHGRADLSRNRRSLINGILAAARGCLLPRVAHAFADATRQQITAAIAELLLAGFGATAFGIAPMAPMRPTCRGADHRGDRRRGLRRRSSSAGRARSSAVAHRPDARQRHRRIAAAPPGRRRPAAAAFLRSNPSAQRCSRPRRQAVQVRVHAEARSRNWSRAAPPDGDGAHSRA